MPLDSVMTTALVSELRGVLINARIDKVQQPERDLILLSIHGPAGNNRLSVCGGVGVARIHLTEAYYENPEHPPMFCMLLRKHLTGARIVSLEQPGRERMLIMHLDCRDEMGEVTKKQLVVELIGRGTNVILTDESGRIIDCLRRVDGDMNSSRQVLPGLFYRLPPSLEKPDFFNVGSEERRRLLSYYDGRNALDKWLLESFSGLSPLICRELVYRAHGEKELLPACMDAFADSVQAGEFSPFLLLYEGKPKEFSFMPITQYGKEMEGETYPSFSALLDAFYTRRSQEEDMRRRTAVLRKTVRNARDRAARKYALQSEELKATARRDEKRRWADLITANLYRAPKTGGAKQMEAEDYYQEDCPRVLIPLDPMKTPQQNAAAYYKEYTKAKTAEQYLTRLIGESKRDMDYLSSVLDEIDRAQSELDIAAIRQELGITGWLRERGGKSEKQFRGKKEAAPLRYRCTGGYEILVGRGNVQNDFLTTRLAHKGDLWFHTQKIHGSHVILRCAGADPDDESIRQAAVLAATHSQAKSGGKVPVDYTRVRFVKKPSGALPGMVVYTEQTTVMAEADANLEERLRAIN